MIGPGGVVADWTWATGFAGALAAAAFTAGVFVRWGLRRWGLRRRGLGGRPGCHCLRRRLDRSGPGLGLDRGLHGRLGSRLGRNCLLGPGRLYRRFLRRHLQAPGGRSKDAGLYRPQAAGPPIRNCAPGPVGNARRHASRCCETGRFLLHLRTFLEPPPLRVNDAPDQDQAGRIQVLRRSDHDQPAEQPRGRGRAERLRQVEHHRCSALGDGGDLGEAPARRLDGRRHLQRLRLAQAGRHRVRRTRVRQLRRQARRRIRELRRGFAEAPGLPRRHVDVLPERRALPSQGHHAAVPRYRPRLAQLRDHRAEHDLPRHRGEDRRNAGLPRGGCRHFAVQGAASRDREPHRTHA